MSRLVFGQILWCLGPEGGVFCQVILYLGTFLTFFSRQAALITTSFDKKLYPSMYNLGRVSAGRHMPGFDALRFMPFCSPCLLGGHKTYPGSNGMFLHTIRSVLPVKIVP